MVRRSARPSRRDQCLTPTKYTDAMLDGMQTAYGLGFLSPGGAEETREMVAGLTVENAHVLDLGCGVGGPAVLLVQELKAARVTGVDVEEEQLRRAGQLIRQLDLEAKIRFQLVEPGPLPLPDESVDIIITKDVICHIPDKKACFEDMLRVLKPGGVFVVADWQLGPSTPEAVFEEWHRQLATAGLVFYFEPVDVYIDTMKRAGFAEVSATDHTEWSRRSAAEQLTLALGGNRDSSIDRLGSDGYDKRTLITKTRLDGLNNGEVEHWHVKGVKAFR